MRKPYEKAQAGRQQIEDAILALLAENPSGLRNVEIAQRLGLKSDSSDAQKDYLTWSLLGGLVKGDKVRKAEKQYRLV